MFIPFKFLFWFLGLRYADSGSTVRPWIFGSVIGLLFGIFDLFTDHLTFLEGTTLFASYLLAACIFMNLRYRLDGILTSIVLAVLGTAVMFFGIPFFMMWLFDTGVD